MLLAGERSNGDDASMVDFLLPLAPCIDRRASLRAEPPPPKAIIFSRSSRFFKAII